MPTECPRTAEVNDSLAGELTAAEQAAFEAHVAECAICRAEFDAVRMLRSRLLSVAEPEPVDLTASVLAQVRHDSTRRRWWPQVAAVAAGVAVLASVLLMREASTSARPTPIATSEGPATGAARGLEWLVRVQEADGSWSAERWGGQALYAPALTALPLLALVAAERPAGSFEAATSRAAANLLAQQNPDGSFGPAFRGAAYNQSIATLALLHVWERRPQEIPRERLDRALARLAAAQLPEGGWGYVESGLGDRSITQWHVLALDQAASLGWKTAAEAAARGVRWLAAHPASLDDASEPEDSTSAVLARATVQFAPAAGMLNLYDAYFRTAALRREKSPDARERLGRLREEILKHQVAEGEDRGSWPALDQWSRAGGRLYSTALASLSLSER